MVITVDEFKANLDNYLELATTQDIFITKNGKNIARLTGPSVDKLAILDNLVGILPQDAPIDENAVREERLSRQ